MAQPKEKKNILDILQEQHEEFERESPILATRYFVVEVTPSFRHWDGYDYSWTKEQRLRVSKYFDTEQECRDWMEKYNPDKGNYFAVSKENLREYKHRKWGV